MTCFFSLTTFKEKNYEKKKKSGIVKKYLYKDFHLLGTGYSSYTIWKCDADLTNARLVCSLEYAIRNMGYIEEKDLYYVCLMNNDLLCSMDNGESWIKKETVADNRRLPIQNVGWCSRMGKYFAISGSFLYASVNLEAWENENLYLWVHNSKLVGMVCTANDVFILSDIEYAYYYNDYLLEWRPIDLGHSAATFPQCATYVHSLDQLLVLCGDGLLYHVIPTGGNTYMWVRHYSSNLYNPMLNISYDRIRDEVSIHNSSFKYWYETKSLQTNRSYFPRTAYSGVTPTENGWIYGSDQGFVITATAGKEPLYEEIQVIPDINATIVHII